MKLSARVRVWLWLQTAVPVAECDEQSVPRAQKVHTGALSAAENRGRLAEKEEKAGKGRTGCAVVEISWSDAGADEGVGRDGDGTGSGRKGHGRIHM